MREAMPPESRYLQNLLSTQAYHRQLRPLSSGRQKAPLWNFTQILGHCEAKWYMTKALCKGVTIYSIYIRLPQLSGETLFWPLTEIERWGFHPFGQSDTRTSYCANNTHGCTVDPDNEGYHYVFLLRFRLRQCFCTRDSFNNSTISPLHKWTAKSHSFFTRQKTSLWKVTPWNKRSLGSESKTEWTQSTEEWGYRRKRPEQERQGLQAPWLAQPPSISSQTARLQKPLGSRSPLRVRGLLLRWCCGAGSCSSRHAGALRIPVMLLQRWAQRLSSLW